VNLVKRSGCKSAAGFTNAVLRKAAANPDDRAGASIRHPIARLSVEVSHPRWMLERWANQLGEAETKLLALANNEPPPMAFRVNTLRADTDETVSSIAAAGVRVVQSALVAGGFRVEGGGAETLNRLAEKGLIYIQDEASQLTSLLVDAREGDLVLDLCAAPGSKSSHLSALTNDLATVIACDLHPHRLQTLNATCARLGVRNVFTFACDATHSVPLLNSVKFDRILLDAPCSGTGTLRHHPEIKWRLTPDDIARLAGIQSALLRQAARCLKTNGRLVYSTCSIEREENEEVVEAFLKESKEFRKAPPASGPRETLTQDGFFRTFPHKHVTDGFFVAVLVQEC
jgi:16S rRNA (cytosine967-C5)-methyltransferase